MNLESGGLTQVDSRKTLLYSFFYLKGLLMLCHSSEANKNSGPYYLLSQMFKSLFPTAGKNATDLILCLTAHNHGPLQT